MNILKQTILKNKYLAPIAISIRNIPREYQLNKATKEYLNSIPDTGDRIFYFGAARHANLGDLAQSMCIREWLKKHYPDYSIVEIETNAVVNTRFSVLQILQKMIKPNDIIVFQSGYTTTDLGGFADEMHRVIMQNFPDNRMLMLPQTIYFVKEENKLRTSKIYNSMKHMLFLARDKVSFQMACEMFPDIPVQLFPDIVTTLIGKKKYEYERNDILFCCRNDGEKYYSDLEINELISRCKKILNVEVTDTTKTTNEDSIVSNARSNIMVEIDRYAHYKLIVTDRYHGTILSLAAGTPVIILKTTDHKVTTGADWFKGVYDEYVTVAESLDDAYDKILDVLNKEKDFYLDSYFEEKYYDALPRLFDEIIS